MADIDNKQFAEFIIAHGKTITWAGSSFDKYQPELLKRLLEVGPFSGNFIVNNFVEK